MIEMYKSATPLGVILIIISHTILGGMMVAWIIEVFERKFSYDAIVYLNAKKKPVKEAITSRILTIDKITVSAVREKTAMKKAFELINKKHPRYKGYARLF